MRVVFSLVLCIPLPGLAADVCENIEGERVIVSEARYMINGAGHTCYANDYFDGAGELSIASGQSIGAAPSNSSDIRFGSSFHFSDDAGAVPMPCANMSIVLTLEASNAVDSAGCPKAPTGAVTVVKMFNSCAFAGAPPALCPNGRCGGFVTGLVGISPQLFKSWWRSTTTVIGSIVGAIPCSAQDQGCFRLQNEQNCQLMNF